MPKLLNPKITTLLDELREKLTDIYGKNLAQIILYGSQARGDAQPDSDIDILIVLNKSFDYSQEIERTSHLIANLSLKYKALISRSFIDGERLNVENSPFIRNIHNEGIVL